jgi:hypothetical protein
MVQNQGFSVDDDNNHVKDNIHTADTPEARGSNLMSGQQWRWDGFDRMKAVHPDKKMPPFRHGWTMGNRSYLDIWLCVILILFIQTTICKATSDAFEDANATALH